MTIKKEEIRKDVFITKNEALNIMANIRQQKGMGTLWEYTRETALYSAGKNLVLVDLKNFGSILGKRRSIRQGRIWYLWI